MCNLCLPHFLEMYITLEILYIETPIINIFKIIALLLLLFLILFSHIEINYAFIVDFWFKRNK